MGVCEWACVSETWLNGGAVAAVTVQLWCVSIYRTLRGWSICDRNEGPVHSVSAFVVFCQHLSDFVSMDRTLRRVSATDTTDLSIRAPLRGSRVIRALEVAAVSSNQRSDTSACPHDLCGRHMAPLKSVTADECY
jgi:hypothetical protein